MKTLILIIAFLISVFVASTNIYYNYMLNQEEETITLNEAVLVSKLLKIADESVKKNSLDLFKNTVYFLQQTTPLKEAKLELKNYTFSDSTLLDKTFLIDNDWFIIDVTVDANIGEVTTLGSGLYKLNLADDKKELQSVNIKFQAIKDSVIKDFFLPFEIKATVLTSSQDNKDINYKKLDKENFTLYLNYKDAIDEKAIDARVTNFMLALGILLLVIVLFAVLLFKFVVYKSFKNSMDSLNNYLSNVLEGKMLDFKEVKTNFKELNTLNINAIELSKKFINTSNDLIVSRDIIYQKERSDELTGLPNKKSFENDLKYMFISNKEGYIIYLKIDKIGLFTKNHGAEIVNSLIEDFAKTVQHYFNTSKNRKGAMYRFFGGEFSMLLYDKNIQNVESFLKEIIELVEKLVDKYYFFDRVIYYGAVPFDQYGTIESNIQSSQDAFDIAISQKTKFYHIVDFKEQAESMKKLEGSIKDIIERNDFVLQYLHDTVEFGDDGKILIQEVSPLIIDGFTFENIPTGKFISVAERLGVAAEFDKALIIKTLEQIEFGELEHQICVILSVSTITNKLFISWLENISVENKFMKQVIFTAPGYSIASNFEDFKNLYSILRRLNIETMIKKYDLTELSLEALEELKPTYLKLDRSFCQDFKKDSIKNNALRHIIDFSQEHNIKVIGDSLKNKQDYLAFEMLGVYGTSN